MARYLNDLFAEAQAPVVEWEGAPLYGVFDLPTVSPGLTFRFLESASDFVQGADLEIRGGVMSGAGVEAKVFRLWEDTAPERVDVSIKWQPRARRSLLVWNTWHTKGLDITHAFRGDAGMRVDELGPGRWRFRCSDGLGDVDFGNNVFEVEMW
jgi:hypothetical protein